MKRIEFHIEAEEELKFAARYYEQKVLGLGSDFLDQIEAGLLKIRGSPFLWPIYEGEYRRYLLKRFPYGMIYRVEERKTIFVIAVAHLHRRPRYWKSRG